MIENPNPKPRMIICIISGFLAHIVFSIQNTGMMICAGVFFPYIASYLVHRNSMFDISIVYNIHTMILATEVIGTCNIYSGISTKLLRYFSNRLILSLGTLFVSLCLVGISFIESPYLFCVLFAISLGFLSGFSSNTTMFACTSLFPQKGGLIVGILMAGLGFAPLLWNVVLMFLLNPENIAPDVDVGGTLLFGEEVADRMPWTLRVVALIVFVLGSVSSLGIARLDFRDGFMEDDSNEVSCAVKSPLFLGLMAGQILVSSVWISFIGIFKSYGLIGLQDDSAVTVIGTICTFFGLFGRLIWPYLTDLYGYKKTVIPLICVNMVVVLVCIWGNKSYVVYGLCTSIVFITSSGFYPCFATALSHFFGPSLAAKLYCFAVLYQPSAGAAYFGLSIVIEELGYNWFWIFCEVILLFAILAIATLKYDTKHDKDCNNQEVDYIKLD